MPNLIEVGESAMRMQEILYDSLGELTPEVEAALDTILKQGEEALENAAWVLRRMAADEAFLRAEAARYEAKAQSVVRAQESLRRRMEFALDATFGGKLKTPTATLSIAQSAETLKIELAPDADLAQVAVDNSELVKHTYALDTTAIKRRYEAGDPIPNAITVTPQPGKRSLRMR